MELAEFVRISIVKFEIRFQLIEQVHRLTECPFTN